MVFLKMVVCGSVGPGLVLFRLVVSTDLERFGRQVALEQ